jgi:hypothetical protein
MIAKNRAGINTAPTGFEADEPPIHRAVLNPHHGSELRNGYLEMTSNLLSF